MAAKRKAPQVRPPRNIAKLEAELEKRTAERDQALARAAAVAAERDEALAQQTATAEVLQVINSSPGHLAPVFEAILDKALRLCEAALGILWVYDGQLFRTAATRGVPTAYEESLREPVRPGPGLWLQQLIDGENCIHTPDLAATPIPASLSARSILDLGGARTGIIVALRKEKQLLGAIRLYRQEVRPFTDKQITLLQSFSAQAVIAMENARLITETREALEQQTATAEVLGVINASPGDLGPVFDAILEKAHALCGADTGSLQLDDGEFVHAVATRGLPDEFVKILRQPRRTSFRDAFLRGAPFVQITDLADPVLTGGDETTVAGRDIAGVRTLLRVPLRKDNALLGWIVAGRREVRPFSQQEISLLQNFAAQAVIAMENARLITETREALEQQTATAEVLGVINASPGDLTPVFDAILEKAHTLCGAALGSLRVFEGDYAQSVAQRGHSAEFADELRQRVPLSNVPVAKSLADGAPFVHILDIAELDHPMARRGVERSGVRTLLAIPLRKDNALLGAIFSGRQEVRAFTDKQIVLLQNFAAQAVIAMENARLINETREALEQQTATAEVLGVINSSPGELAPVFDAILEKAMRLCETTFGHLMTWDGERFHRIAFRGMPDDLIEEMRQPMKPVPGSFLDQVVQGTDLVRHADLHEAEAGSVGPGAASLMRFGARARAMVALRKDERLLGTIAVYRTEVRPFSDKQIALLQNFAAQAVIAMENARLITETREALEQQTAAAEVLGVINASPGDPAPVFEAMLEKASRLCDAPNGQLAIYDGEFFRFVAAHGEASHVHDLLARGTMLPVSGTTWPRIVAGEHVVHIPDVMESEHYRAGHENTRRFVDVGGGRSLLSVALRKDNVLMGALSVYRREARPFSEKQIALLQNFAAQAVIAMENARLITETREALEQQTATAEVLGVINSSPGDLQPVFDTILEKAHSLCGIAFGSLQLYEDGKVHAVAARAIAEDLAELLREPMAPRPGSALSRLLAGDRFVQNADILEVAQRVPDDPRIQLSAARGLRTGLWVPLRKEGDFLGYISAFRDQVRPFSEKEISVLESFAAQAVIAMENARLLGELRQRTDEVAELNRGLETRVAEQVEELGRVGRLKRFLAPQLAELIVSQGDEKILESHRREIVVVFCDLRGYTAFTETAEPEEVLDFLREYHGALGPLVAQFEGTLDQFSGDGIMVFFNDPVPIPDPAERAVNMAIAMRAAAGGLIGAWRRRGRELGFGAGVAQGYATLGQIGFADRSGYTAIGTVCNLAARLCAEAKDGQILIAQRVAVAVEQNIALEEIGSLTLKGLTQPVVAFNVPLAASQPALRVIDGGPQSV